MVGEIGKVEEKAQKAKRVARIDAILKGLYQETTLLAYDSAFTLTVAAVLAAQCTDERVNAVTSTLFKRYPDAKAFAAAESAELEDAVHSTGFYRQKAATLKKLCAALVERFGGEIPDTLEEFVTMPGIGRKTANLVLGNARDKPAIFVDTHVKRLSARMGLTAQTDPDKIEAALAPLVEEKRRTAFSNLLTHLGREYCAARKARCGECPVAEHCPKVGV